MNLYPHQVDGIAWLADRRRCLLADEPGLGKTRQAIEATLQSGTGSMLVICPASVKYNWADEIRKWSGGRLSAEVLSGRGSLRMPVDGEALIANYDLLPYTSLDAFRSTTPVTLVYDECHMLRNSRAQRTMTALAVNEYCLSRNDRVIGLSGTPLVNRPGELWTVMAALGCERVFGSKSQYDRNFTLSNGRWEVNPKASSRLRRVMLRRRKADVMRDLPDKAWRVVRVQPRSRKTKQLLDDGKKRLDLYEKLKRQGSGQLLPHLSEISRIRKELAHMKLDAASELAQSRVDAGCPVVVFSAHRGPVISLGERDGWTCIHGSVSDRERSKRIATFQDGGVDGIALTIGAGREGINLFRAHEMIFVDLDWTPAYNIQAEDRIHRINQKNACLYTVIVFDHPLEYHLGSILYRKEGLFNDLVERAA